MLFRHQFSSLYTEYSFSLYLSVSPLNHNANWGTAHIPWKTVRSSVHELWKSVIRGQQKKAANAASKYITAHFGRPELCWHSVGSPNLDLALVGTTAHAALRNGGQLHRGSQNATSQSSAAGCMTWVGSWVGALSLSSVCVFLCPSVLG